VLFVLEAKFTSHGVLGIGGAAAMVLGAMLLVDSPLPEMRIKLSTAVALAAPFSIITILLVSLVIKARANKVITGHEGMIGETGVASGTLAPEGMIMVRGEYWTAVSRTPVAAGTPVRVTEISGLRLTVEPIAKQGD
jgi:membrane-bound serine protease (ClpP class)